MEVAVHLSCRDLKKVVDAIFDRLLAGSSDITVPIPESMDFYWEVPNNHLHDVAGAQPQLDVGRLSDDWEFLTQLLNDDEQAVRFMLVHVAPLLRFLGEAKKESALPRK